MKNRIKIFICFLLLVAINLVSCTLQKRKYTGGYYSQWNNSHSKQVVKASQNSVSNDINLSGAVANDPANNYSASLSDKPEIYIDKPEQLIIEANNAGKCDLITLKSGEKIEGLVAAITDNDVKYKSCRNLDGPTLLVEKQNVMMIEYANGTKVNFTSGSPDTKKEQNEYVNPNPNPNTNTNPSQSKAVDEKPKKLEILGLIGFITSIGGLFVAGIPLGSVAVAFGIISLFKIKNHPEKFKRKRGFAIASILIGLLAIIGAIVFLVLM